jgi:phage terminase small subunit
MMSKPKFEALLAAGDMDKVIENLSVKQKRFIDEYLVDFNATQAILRAGYNTKWPNRMGSEMLDHPGIRAVIDKIALERADKSIIKPDYVIKKIMRTVEKAENDNNHSAVLRGCELLARHLGMFIERTEISGPDGGAIKTERVREAADAFTSAISSLIERSGTGEIPIIVESRD